MEFSRRAFLKLAGKAGLAAPFLLGAPACSFYTAKNFDAATGLSLGYVSGDVTPDGAVVWLRAEPDSMVSLEYGKDPALRSPAATVPVKVAPDSDYTAKILLGGLEPATAYYYRAAVAGKTPGPIASFKTAPATADAAVVRFCFGGDTREGYKPFSIMDAIRAQRPDFFIHLGDTIYADRGAIAYDLADFWAKHRANRDDAPSRRLFSETSAYVIWDDHEVRDNYEAGHPLAPAGQRAFIDYWPLRRDAAEPQRIYRSFRWGKALEVFLLDTRQYRDHRAATMLGSRQNEWLLEGLARSSANFKIIATSVPFYGGGWDRWEAFSRERAAIVKWLERKKITGVAFISADIHYAAVGRVPGRAAMKEIVTGPLAAQLNVFGIGYAGSVEFSSNKSFNYGMMTIDPGAAAPRALVEIFDEENRGLYKTTLESE